MYTIVDRYYMTMKERLGVYLEGEGAKGTICPGLPDKAGPQIGIK
jgi:hypothetical protein